MILEEEQAYEPDVLFVPQVRVGTIKEAGVFGAPDLVIEILSASTANYDRGAKFRAYERAGVRELWLLDPYGPAGTEFYQLQGKRLAPVMPDAQGIIRSVAVPGFWIRVEWLWPKEKFIAVSEALRQVAAGLARSERATECLQSSLKATSSASTRLTLTSRLTFTYYEVRIRRKSGCNQ